MNLQSRTPTDEAKEKNKSSNYDEIDECFDFYNSAYPNTISNSALLLIRILAFVPSIGTFVVSCFILPVSS